MSINAESGNGGFKPLREVSGTIPGRKYQVLSEDELSRLAEDLQWLKALERSFEFWVNDEDATYDR